MLISKLRDLDKQVNNPAIQDLVTNLEKDFIVKFLLVLEEVFDHKQSDKFNNHYGLESVASVFQNTKSSLLKLPNRMSSHGDSSILGSNHDLIHSLSIQAGMIYDLGCAFHSKMYVLKDQIVDILIGAFGGPVNLESNNIFVNVSGKLDVSNEQLSNKCKVLFEHIQREAKDFAVINSLNLPNINYKKIWVQNKTRSIAKLTKAFYKNEALHLDEASLKYDAKINRVLNIEKIIGLMNLTQASFNPQRDLIKTLDGLLRSFECSKEETELLNVPISGTTSARPVDIKLLSKYNQKENFCLDLIILAKRTKEIDRGERLFIYNYGKKIKWNHHQIDNLLL